MYRQAAPELKAEYDKSILNLNKEIEQVNHEIFQKLQLLFMGAIYKKIQSNEPDLKIDELTKLAAKMREPEFMVVKLGVE